MCKELYNPACVVRVALLQMPKPGAADPPTKFCAEVLSVCGETTTFLHNEYAISRHAKKVPHHYQRYAS
jgi:hypothetical protein